MIILCYDISNDKLRTQFSKFLSKFGYRIQYSVFEIENSDRILNNVLTEIKVKFEKRFSESDSVMIFKLSETCKIIKIGYAKHEDDSIIIV
mgnify:CR=1 FL=1